MSNATHVVKNVLKKYKRNKCVHKHLNQRNNGTKRLWRDKKKMQRSISLRGFNDPIYQSRSVYETHHVPGQHGGQHGGQQQPPRQHAQHQHIQHQQQQQQAIYGHVPRQRKRALFLFETHFFQRHNQIKFGIFTHSTHKIEHFLKKTSRDFFLAFAKCGA